LNSHRKGTKDKLAISFFYDSVNNVLEKEFQVVDDDITVKIKKKEQVFDYSLPKYCCAFLRINKNL
jgi:hypothetical protein